MNSFFKQVLVLFFAITLSNVLVDLAVGDEIGLFKNPVRFLGTAIILSLIGGYIIDKIIPEGEGKV